MARVPLPDTPDGRPADPANPLGRQQALIIHEQEKTR